MMLRVMCTVFVIHQNKLFSSQFGAAGMALEKGEPLQKENKVQCK
jgi:hypothetical protein